jgi:exopolysaccharide production protein ExoZ
MSQQDKSVLYSLQIGRAVAALAVVLHHSAVAIQFNFTEYPNTFINSIFLGYLGVEYFFVLSGFIIAHIAQTMPPTVTEARRYAYSRFVRIYIPYLPISLAMIAMFLLIPTLSAGARDSFSYIGSLFLLPSNGPPALSVAWTLQHEVIFYTLFGISYFVFGDIKCLFLWAIPMFIALFFPTPQWLYTLVAPINFEFLLGVAAYYAYKSGRFFPLRHVCLVLGLAIVFISCYLLYDRVVSSYRFLASVGFAGVVLGLALMERYRDYSKLRPLVYLGAASYSIYLVHGPILSVLMRFSPYYGNWAGALVTFAVVSTFMGICYYIILEKPMLTRLKNRYLVR